MEDNKYLYVPINHESLQEGNSYLFVKDDGKTSFGSFVGNKNKDEFHFVNLKKSSSKRIKKITSIIKEDDITKYKFYQVLEPIEKQFLQEGNSYLLKKKDGKTSFGTFVRNKNKDEFPFVNLKKSSSKSIKKITSIIKKDDLTDYNFYQVLEQIEEQSLQKGNPYLFVKKKMVKLLLEVLKAKMIKSCLLSRILTKSVVNIK
jgi:hypothetical protein